MRELALNFRFALTALWLLRDFLHLHELALNRTLALQSSNLVIWAAT